MRSRVRHSDTMVAIETAPATVDFSDILEKTQVIPDYDMQEAPWENCDGWEHNVTQYVTYHVLDNASGSVVTRDKGRVVIFLPDDQDWGIYEYLRERGATKQVAREAVASARREALAQLVKWYSDGWEWWGVTCEYSILNEAYYGSCWRIDNLDYAKDYVKVEIALEVAMQLEQAGYTVTGKPEGERGLSAQYFGTIVSSEGIKKAYSRRILSPERWKEEWKRNMASQNWKAE